MYTGVGRREDTNSPVTTRLIQEVADSETITGMLNPMRDISHGRTCIRAVSYTHLTLPTIYSV